MRNTRFAAAILLAAYLPACTSYQAMTAPATELQAPPKPIRAARITLSSGERFELRTPLVYGDSIRGFNLKGQAENVAMADVTKVEVKKVSASKTVGLVLGTVVVGGIIAGAVYFANCDSQPSSFGPC